MTDDDDSSYCIEIFIHNDIKMLEINYWSEAFKPLRLFFIRYVAVIGWIISFYSSESVDDSQKVWKES